VFFGFVEWIKPTFLIYFLSIYEHARKDKKLFSRKMYNCICEVLDLAEKSLPLSVSIVVLKAFPPSHYTGTCAYRFVKFGPFQKQEKTTKTKFIFVFIVIIFLQKTFSFQTTMILQHVKVILVQHTKQEASGCWQQQKTDYSWNKKAERSLMLHTVLCCKWSEHQLQACLASFCCNLL